MSKNKKNRSTLKSSTYETSRNKVYKEGKFKSKRKWYDYKGMFFIIPSFMYEKNIDLNVNTKVNRLIIAIGYHRWSFDFGFYKPTVEKKIWDKKGLNDFLDFARKKTNSKWNVKDIEAVLNKDKNIKKLIYTVGVQKHYVKIILLRKMIDVRNLLNINETDPESLKIEKIRVGAIADSKEEDDDIAKVLGRFNTILDNDKN